MYMAEQSSSNTLSTVLAFAAGISAGAVASMLLAPKSGAETREQIKSKIQKYPRTGFALLLPR